MSQLFFLSYDSESRRLQQIQTCSFCWRQSRAETKNNQQTSINGMEGETSKSQLYFQRLVDVAYHTPFTMANGRSEEMTYCAATATDDPANQSRGYGLEYTEKYKVLLSAHVAAE